MSLRPEEHPVHHCYLWRISRDDDEILLELELARLRARRWGLTITRREITSEVDGTGMVRVQWYGQ